MSWRDRIVAESSIAPGELTAHPENWRRHPHAQRDAMRGALNELGWLQRIVVNRLSGRVIDGHLRLDLAVENGEESVPVIYVELNEEEERMALASIDTITAMAETDAQALAALLEQVDAQDQAFMQLLDTTRLDALAMLEHEQDEGDDDSGDRSGSDDGSFVRFEVSVTRGQRDRIEATLESVREDRALETQADALIALCQTYGD